MDATCSDATAPPPPRPSFRCNRHPDKHHTGFCPSCLCERLTTLDSGYPSAAIESVGSSTWKEINLQSPSQVPQSSERTSFLPERRRSKSFSASKNEFLALVFEPWRKSCNKRVRNNSGPTDNKRIPALPSASSAHENHKNSNSMGSCAENNFIFKELINEEDFRDPKNLQDGLVLVDDDRDGDHVVHVQDMHLKGLRNLIEQDLNSGDTVEGKGASVGNLKPTKNRYLDLDTHGIKSLGGGFRAAVSVLSEKWYSWRRKQKSKKQSSNGENSTTLPAEKSVSWQYRENESGLADYKLVRRSWDGTDPRFSIDARRISFDDAIYSFERPRASWDGHGRIFPRMIPMVSIMEDAPNVNLSRFDDIQFPLVANCVDEDGTVPGGSVQTKEYYLDSSSRRRKSLGRCNLIRKTSAAEIDD